MDGHGRNSSSVTGQQQQQRGDDRVVGGSSPISSIQSKDSSPSADGASAVAVEDTVHDDSPVRIRRAVVDPLARDDDDGDDDDMDDPILLDRSTDLPSFLQHRRRRRRRPHHFSATGTTTTTTTGDDSYYYHPPAASATSSLAQSAVHGTVGLLRSVGGATLSVTGAIVKPPLSVTKQFLLPQLYSLLVDLYNTHTPSRLQAWIRIIHCSISHIFTTLRDTSTGHNLRKQWGQVGHDVLDLGGTELLRQWLVDGMGSVVKLAELLNTDEAIMWFDQVAVTTCRAIEVLSHPRVLLLVHDLRHAVAALATLLADPVATSALAEVTAYLCYALAPNTDDDEVATSRERRHAYQTAHNLRDTVAKHPNMTVEEAIMSSLDPFILPRTNDANDDDDERFEPPSSSPPSQQLPWDTVSSIRDHVEHTTSTIDGAAAAATAIAKTNMDRVDVQYLREMMEERAMDRQKRRRNKTTTTRPQQQQQVKDPIVTVQHAAAGATTATSATKHSAAALPARRPRVAVVETVTSDDDENDDDDDVMMMGRHNDHQTAMNGGDEPPRAAERAPIFTGGDDETNKLRWDGEAPMDQFERIVNEILAKQRRGGRQYLHHTKEAATPAALPHRSWTKVTATTPTRKTRSGGKLMVVLGVVAFLAMGTVWFGFGCLGCYLYWKHHYPAMAPTSSSSSSAMDGHHEIVVRVVREVVHVDTHGKVLGRGLLPQQNAPGPSEYEKVAACVAEAYKA
jgi:hypothetical protein